MSRSRGLEEEIGNPSVFVLRLSLLTSLELIFYLRTTFLSAFTYLMKVAPKFMLQG